MVLLIGLFCNSNTLLLKTVNIVQTWQTFMIDSRVQAFHIKTFQFFQFVLPGKVKIENGALRFRVPVISSVDMAYGVMLTSKNANAVSVARCHLTKLLKLWMLLNSQAYFAKWCTIFQWIYTRNIQFCGIYWNHKIWC